jgi:hypothetical protein
MLGAPRLSRSQLEPEAKLCNPQKQRKVNTARQ